MQLIGPTEGIIFLFLILPYPIQTELEEGGGGGGVVGARANIED